MAKDKYVITDKQVRDLRGHSIEVNDWRQVDICDVALGKRPKHFASVSGTLKDSSGKTMTRAKARSVCASQVRRVFGVKQFRFTVTVMFTLREDQLYPEHPWKFYPEHLGARDEDDLTVAAVMKRVQAMGGAVAIIDLSPDSERTSVDLDVEPLEDLPYEDDDARNDAGAARGQG